MIRFLARLLAQRAIKFLQLHLLAHVTQIEEHLPLSEVVELLNAPGRCLHVPFRVVEAARPYDGASDHAPNQNAQYELSHGALLLDGALASFDSPALAIGVVR